MWNGRNGKPSMSSEQPPATLTSSSKEIVLCRENPAIKECAHRRPLVLNNVEVWAYGRPFFILESQGFLTVILCVIYSLVLFSKDARNGACPHVSPQLMSHTVQSSP